ncbi:glutamine amidotransferase [Pseudomonas sp. NPDC090592]|uniref:glutamine amidotransferase n=1 Tax=Pseudomonas sp. NPDC090592 TaxID=3364480 RepID=UPI00383A9B95
MTDVVILQAGTAPDDMRHDNGDIPHWFLNALQSTAHGVEVVKAYLEDATLPTPTTDRVAIITGSWSMVTDRHPWSENLAAWIRQAIAVGMPLFGICYGHQLMAHALGGSVDYHVDGCEIGCLPVRLTAAGTSDPLLGQWPSAFPAHLTHLQTVTCLPPGAQVLAYSDHDPHQIIRYAANAISVQFHPEFTLPLAAACIRRREATLASQGLDLAQLLSDLQDTADAKRLLLSFIQLSRRTVSSSMESHNVPA